MADDSGTVSGLLFTDLEGSTAHLRALSDRYGEVLARHNEIIRSAVTEAGGTEVGAEGDSIAALFPSPAAGVRAAIAAQRALATEPWPDSPWRVRMAVHAGVVETTGAGAIGIGLHEAARLRNIAHGGQIVVSEAAATHGVDAQLTDLGLHNVRDFATPVRIHQVKATGLDDSFPPLRTSAGRDIPRAATPFIGRVDELEALLTVLSTSQIVTLTGAGGSGKTRLAYEVARRVETPWIVVVELAGLRDPSQVEGQIATRVGVGDPSAIASAIGERELLLVMDNCEHVVDAAASIVASLASVCTNLSVLATSREPLHVTGERVWPVPVLQPREASELFQSRAQTRRDEALIATMCERLGWMPLAIELAAARVRSMPLDQLVSRLDDQLRVLTTGARDIPRQQTLRATLDWSHQLLTYDEGVVFRRVGVFAGGFTLPAAEAVAVVPTDVDVPRALDGLVMKSLVDFTPEGRYRMLEPVRQYAIERLQEVGEEERVLEGHLRWVTHIATDTARQLFVDRESVDVLDHERDNVGAAIGWAFDTGRLVQSTNLVSRLAWYWFTSGRSESYVWLPRLLDQVDSLEIRDRGKA
ncbi:MAG: hypothetical protein QOC92_4110, partial [Acidimicrobiaceae bacterium]